MRFRSRMQLVHDLLPYLEHIQEGIHERPDREEVESWIIDLQDAFEQLGADVEERILRQEFNRPAPGLGPDERIDGNPQDEPLEIKKKPDTQARAKTGSASGAKKPPSREGKSALTGHFSPEVKRQLHVLAAKEGKTMQALLAEAINELFRKRGLEEIAES